MMKEQVYNAKQATKKGQNHRVKRKHEGDGDGYQQKRRGGGGRGGGRDRKKGGRGFGRERSKRSQADPEAWCRIPNHNHKWKDYK